MDKELESFAKYIKTEQAMRIAKELLKEGVDLATIKKVTKLSQSKIKKLMSET